MAAVAENSIVLDENLMHRSSSTTDGAEEKIESKSDLQCEVRKLVDLLSKLNPSAKEFFPSQSFAAAAAADSVSQSDLANQDSVSENSSNNRRKYNYNQWRRRLNGRTVKAQREDSIRRTVYVAEIDQHVTEERLAVFFIHCGHVVDCRICGDPRSLLRFAFVEFADERGARMALNHSGTMLGYFPVRVLPSKTAILPVNPTFLPRSEDEREMCARTVYCTNIDKEVTQTDLRHFFGLLCGEVSRLRLLGDQVHSTRIAFVEFVLAESAITALNCSGMFVGALPIRVSPSKTPVRPRIQHAA